MFRMKPKDDAKKDDTKDPKASQPATDSPKPKADTKPADAKPAPKKPAGPPTAGPPMPGPDDAPAPMGGPPDAIDAAPAIPIPDAGAAPVPPPMGGLDPGAAPVPLLGKLSQLTSGYLGPENGPFMCGNCRHFDGQGGCDIVDGLIDPQGCCSVFEAGDQMGGMEPVPSPQPSGDLIDSGVVAGLEPQING